MFLVGYKKMNMPTMIKEIQPPTQEQALSWAYQSLNTAFESWYALEDRIAKGRAYMAAHPTDANAARLLAELEGQAATAESAYLAANATYIALCGEKEVTA